MYVYGLTISQYEHTAHECTALPVHSTNTLRMSAVQSCRLLRRQANLCPTLRQKRPILSQEFALETNSCLSPCRPDHKGK
jgi:hypothetical protein